MQRLFILICFSLVILMSCQNESASDNSNRDNEAIEDIATPVTIFNCQLNEMAFNADATTAEVFQTDEKIDSIVISGTQAGVTIKSFIYLFDGVGDYPFKNNEAGQGIARGELLQVEDGKTKSFFSISGSTYISYLSLDKKILSGTFEGSYFYKGDEMPETFDAEQGSFNNLPITVIKN